jgi:hypothetical protein
MAKFSESKRKRKSSVLQTATDPHPGNFEFEIGSLESRAAARALAQDRNKEEMTIQIVLVSPDGSRNNGSLLRIPRVELPPREA